MKKAFITGITGQDGAWLAKYLLSLGYEVHGGVRRISTPNFWRLEFLGIKDKVKLHEYDLIDPSSNSSIISTLKPDEVYNLAAQSFVGTSFTQPQATFQMNAIGPLNILEAIRINSPETKFYQASTSEMFGLVQEIPQRESTPFYPRSPYGVAKLAAHWSAINYRESYNIFAACGILFNHESELRGEEFVTRKITMNVTSWANNVQGNVLELGNLDAKRDWGYAKEYVEGMHAMLQAEKPDAFVLATGETYTIRQFVEWAFEVIGRSIMWEGQGVDEIGRDKDTGEILLKINPQYYRPAEVELLIGNPTKASEVLGWRAKTKAQKLAKLMVESDINLTYKK